MKQPIIIHNKQTTDILAKCHGKALEKIGGQLLILFVFNNR